MNNQQFRRLLVDNPAPQNDNAGSSATPPPARASGAVLGARKSASIPMTPRQVGRSAVQADFARQLAERNAKANVQKKFRSAAPKGSKLAAGFIDRTKERVDEHEDERAKRIKNLEEAMKLGQIDNHTFEKLVQDITGGDLTATHLVKGLDRRLLERVRNGEDVFAPSASGHVDQSSPVDVEDEFDELAEKELGPIVREKSEKKGELAPVRPTAGVKRSRADILAELKRQREDAAALAAAEHEKRYPSLGNGFRKVNGRGESSRIEVDRYGRDVLIITDAQGKEKRKVRKQKIVQPHAELRHDLDDEKKPINTHHLPQQEDPKEASEDEDIFEGVGSTYNPLANLNSNDEDSSSEEGDAAETGHVAGSSLPKESNPKIPREVSSERTYESLPYTTTALNPSTKRDYFASSKSSVSSRNDQGPVSSAADATVRAALQKVRNLDPSSTLLHDADSEDSRLKARLAKLAASDRDMDDIDMGFGGSRFDDAEEMEREGEKIKFSEWKGIGAGADDEGEGGDRGGKKRKRGPKKKKGDKHNAVDVLDAMERQRQRKLG